MANFNNELNNYQNIPRSLIFDNTLSDRARFVFCFMASKPDGWEFFLEPMAKEIGYSVETLRKYINELVDSGWLEKGEQKKEKGMFGATEYTLKAVKSPSIKKPCTEITVSEKIRVGKNPILNKIDNKQKQDNKEKEINKSISEKDEAFEQCWIAYRRKGSKAKSKQQWNKLTDDEKEMIAEHIKHYVESISDIKFQKDFERYLKDKMFLNVVYKNNMTLFDPDDNNETTTDNDTLIINGVCYK